MKPPKARTDRSIFLLAIVVVALAATITLFVLRKRADESRQLESLLIRTEALAFEVKSLQLQALYDRKVDSELLSDLRRVRLDLLQTVNRVKRLKPNDEAAARCFETYGEYVSAVDQELVMIAAGRVEESHRFNSEQVSPRYQPIKNPSL